MSYVEEEFSEAVEAVPVGPGLKPSVFDRRLLNQFCTRSISEETRRAYRRVVLEFFSYFRFRDPRHVQPADVIAWRDSLIVNKKSAATVTFKLSVIRSCFEYLRLEGHVAKNPASTKYVPPPAVSEELRGRALSAKEVRDLLAGPDRQNAQGARDFALLLMMVRLSLRVAEVCSLKASSIRWSHGRWTLRFKVKGGRERTVPLPGDLRDAINRYMELDAKRRYLAGVARGDEDVHIFLPHTNYRTGRLDKPISTTMVWNIVRKWGCYCGLGKLSPHDLRRTAITRALNQGLTFRQVQMMSGHRDPKTLQRYDHDRQNLDQNAINYLSYAEDRKPGPSSD
jgi:integrase/recombinase XerD